MAAKIRIPPYPRRLKKPAYTEHVIEELRERMREGPVTLGKEDLERIIAMLELLSERCGAAYQVVGQLAERAGLFHDPAVVRVLDVLARPLDEGEILPFDPQPVNDSRKKRAKPKRVSKRNPQS